MSFVHRKIIHVDMDAFFAAVEQRDNPELRGKPVAVGSPEARSVVSAASYEARKFGIHSAMPSVTALRKCPGLIFVYPRFNVYKEISDQVMAIFHEFTDLVEPMSLDEAYLDVTQNKLNMPSATLIAKRIRERIFEETGLTASAGIAVNKFLAKVASDMNKPDGLTLIRPEDMDAFIDKLPVGKIPYIGSVTEQKMKRLGIRTGGDLKRHTREQLVEKFGKPGNYYYEILRNEHYDPVTPEHTRKSLGAERTFDEDITDENVMLEALGWIAGIVAKRLNKHNIKGKTVTLKIKYFDFVQKTRSKTLNFYINPDYELLTIARELFYSPIPPVKPVRLLGISVSGLNTDEDIPEPGQMTMEF